MTYTKKKIVIEADVPEGATHYIFDQKEFMWVGVHATQGLVFWCGKDSYWMTGGITIKNSGELQIKPIEVIE